MSFPIRRYPLDPTGLSMNNYVSGEEHVLGAKSGPYHPVAPFYGPYYNDEATLRVYKEGTLLSRGVDYWGVNLIQDETARFSGEVCEILILKGMSEGDVVTISYQNLGGLFQNHAKGLVDLYNAYLADNRPIDWTQGLKNKPSSFPPSYHLHMLNDVVGWESIIVVLERMISAITLQNVPAFESLIDWVNTRFDTVALTMGGTPAQITTLLNLPNGSSDSTIPENKFTTLRNLFLFKNWIIQKLNEKAPIVSPVFQGLPKTPTAPLESSDDQIANTEFVKNVVAAINEIVLDLKVTRKVYAGTLPGVTGGYSFHGDNNSGMFSPENGKLDFYVNNQKLIALTDNKITFNIPLDNAMLLVAPPPTSNDNTVASTAFVKQAISTIRNEKPRHAMRYYFAQL